MLVSFDELAQYRKLVTLVDGAFDPLHPGHLRYFHVARSFGQPLLVNVCPDSHTSKKHLILLPAPTRAKLINELAVVSYVHLSRRPTVDILHQLQPRTYCKGDDWHDRLPPEQIAACAEHGIAIAYTKTMQQSSTELLRQCQPDMDAFEQFVLNQKPADKPWEPVTDYSFEARKAIEGKHPELIRDVFCPRHVLDAGCGLGHLVRVLRGWLNLDAIGFDVNPPTGDHFYRQDLCATAHPIEWNMPWLNYDLVINRECLEHLTVCQIHQAVRNLCTLSSRFVYLTTRFNVTARHFLDFATSDDLDPSHISIMPQAWLRHLFTLEGFKRRADLEAHMDHMKKGRVLVYERV